MTDPTRRDFMKTAGIAGAGALVGERLMAGSPQSSTTPATTGGGSIAAAGATLPPGAATGTPVPLAPPDEQPPDLKVPKPVKKKVGYAVVGLGELALGEVMPAFGECQYSEPVALVSGHPDKARRVAEFYHIDPQSIYNYDNYDELAKNDKVDAIYIILPNNMHAEFTIRGLKAGKHVLCEKPMASTVEECERMIAAADAAKKKLMIAYRLHYEPFNLKVMELCEQKAFGKIKTFSSSNCQNVKAPNIRLSKELGGGPLGDVGVYSINAARYVTREEPTEVTGVAQQPADDPRFREVPESVAFTMKFPSGVIAHCDCSFGTEVSRKYRVHCENGYIDMDPAFSYTGLQLHTMQSAGGMNGKLTKHDLLPANHFAGEMDHFSQCILHDTPPRTPGQEGLADTRVIVAIDEAIKTGRSVKVKI